MNTIDPQKAAQVWQRVRGTARLSDRELTTMISNAWTTGATYLKLSRQFQGKESAMLRQLHSEQLAHVACLKGIYTLITGTRSTIKAAPLPYQDPEAILRRCYGRSLPQPFGADRKPEKIKSEFIRKTGKQSLP